MKLTEENLCAILAENNLEIRNGNRIITGLNLFGRKVILYEKTSDSGRKLVSGIQISDPADIDGMVTELGPVKDFEISFDVVPPSEKYMNSVATRLFKDLETNGGIQITNCEELDIEIIIHSDNAEQAFWEAAKKVCSRAIRDVNHAVQKNMLRYFGYAINAEKAESIVKKVDVIFCPPIDHLIRTTAVRQKDASWDKRRLRTLLEALVKPEEN